MTEPYLITIAEACELSRYGKSTVYEVLKTGVVETVGAGRGLRIVRASFVAVLDRATGSTLWDAVKAIQAERSGSAATSAKARSTSVQTAGGSRRSSSAKNRAVSDGYLRLVPKTRGKGRSDS